MDVKELIKGFKNKADSIHASHTTWNWSESEQCIRHPNGPIGVIVRDQGHLDLFAGKTRSILTMKGESVHIATFYTVFSENINLLPRDINNLKILNKHFNTSLFKGQKLPALLSSSGMNNISVIGPQTKWDDNTSQFINTVSLETIFEAVDLFQTCAEDPYLLSSDSEIFNILNQAIGI